MNTPISVTAAIIIKDGLILAAKRKAGLHLEGLWEFPGGKIEEDELPEECLKRELFEEFGIQTQIGSFIGESVFEYPEKTVRLLGFLTTHTGGEFNLTDHDEIRWISASHLHELKWAPADIPLVNLLLDMML